MDDFNTTILSEAKNEYSARLVTILSPLIIEGVKSIFSEAWDLCKQNEEEEKYLMTFQNFLSRVIKWNATIIADETKRIVNKSGCNYLDDLLTCVHITQLKILTSIRVAQKQKKIDIEIPKLENFVHKIYISLSRKIYSNVYLFEKNVTPLQYQKNMRECEIMCRESILNVIRDTIPVEKILRAYIDETVDEEIIQETTETVTEDTSGNTLAELPLEKKKEKDDKIVVSKEPDKKESLVKASDESKNTSEKVIVETKPDLITKTEDKNPITNAIKEEINQKLAEKPAVKPQKKEVVVAETAIKVDTEPSPQPQQKREVPERKSSPAPAEHLSFNNTDSVLDMATNTISDVTAPKNLKRLEEISKIRHEQRKIEEAEEEEEEEKINIDRGGPNIKLDILDIHSLDKPTIKIQEPILENVQILT